MKSSKLEAPKARESATMEDCVDLILPNPPARKLCRSTKDLLQTTAARSTPRFFP
jgi:hypothetical protein